MKRFCVIADDFTGAYDIGVQMKKKGINANVFYNTKDILQSGSVILDTETRIIERQKSYCILRELMNNIKDENFNIYFKKIDSFFRGNIWEEILAVDEILNFDVIVIAPSYPKLGRIVRNGIFYLNDMPLKGTDLLLDPSNKSTSDSIIDTLKKEINYPYTHLELQEIDKANETSKVVSYDAVTDDDLNLIVEKYWNSQQKVLWVGSIGLMNAILSKCTIILPTLCVVGSISNISRMHINEAAKRGKKIIFIKMQNIINGESYDEYIYEAITTLKKSQDVILCTFSDDVLVNRSEMIIEQKSEKINTIIGKIVSGILKITHVSGMLLTGGDTARSILKTVGYGTPRILGELFPSVLIINQKIENNGATNILLKSGRVGNDTVLLECIEKLKDYYVYNLMKCQDESSFETQMQVPSSFQLV